MIGIMAAMAEELECYIKENSHVTRHLVAGREYYELEVNAKPAIVVLSGIGKVAAASTATTLIHKFGVAKILFTGVAGSISSEAGIGDIVIAKNLAQHDLDASPFFPKYEIPILGETLIEACATEREHTEQACRSFLSKIDSYVDRKDLEDLGLSLPKLVVGDIASGDQFIKSKEQSDSILEGLPSIVAVEMEGAAVAQVCFENAIPFCVVRTISDAANHEALVDFPRFIQKVSSRYSYGILKELLA